MLRALLCSVTVAVVSAGSCDLGNLAASGYTQYTTDFTGNPKGKMKQKRRKETGREGVEGGYETSCCRRTMRGESGVEDGACVFGKGE